MNEVSCTRTQHRATGEAIVMFVCLRVYVQVNNFSIILGRLPGFNQYSTMGMKCHAQGHSTAPPGEAIVMFVCLRVYVQVNNFSIILGRLPGFNQYSAMGMKCHAQGHSTAPPGEAIVMYTVVGHCCKVQSLYFLKLKYHTSSHLVCLCSLLGVRPRRKPKRWVF